MTTSSIFEHGFIRLFNLILVPALLIMLFTYTAAAKFINHSLFLHQLSRMPVIKSYAAPISFFIPFIEILIAVLLIIKSSRISGLALSSVLMLIFTMFVAFILTGDHQPCSCGGVISKMSWTQHLYFNIIFFILAVTSLFHHKFFTRVQGSKPKTLE